MGKCRSYRPRKRKFHGNQNTSTEIASSNEEIMTASSLKLQQCNDIESTSLSLKACIPPTRKKKLLTAAISIGEKIMNDAAKGIRQLKKSIHATVNCGVSVDGTWQRRGFSSLNGCVSAISVDTGKIIDFETLSQFCRKCNSKTEQQNVKLQCNHPKGSSSSMEPVGAYRIFERSEDHRMLRYTDYYGDGDSKAFDAVKDIYGKDILLRS
ncbi:uncharacterized protein TNCV_2698861 [Trichonephila clavipes]|nr:uncharacterized protein TNCV_2698861 [Trichonephila clavipes]